MFDPFITDLGDPLVECREWFNDTFEENFEILKHYPRGIGDSYLWKIGGNKSQPDQILTSFPVIVTAASSGFYPRSLSLLLSIYKLLLPRYKNIKVIYYDMGLNEALYNEVFIFIIYYVMKYREILIKYNAYMSQP